MDSETAEMQKAFADYVKGIAPIPTPGAVTMPQLLAGFSKEELEAALREHDKINGAKQ